MNEVRREENGIKKVIEKIKRTKADVTVYFQKGNKLFVWWRKGEKHNIIKELFEVEEKDFQELLSLLQTNESNNDVEKKILELMQKLEESLPLSTRKMWMYEDNSGNTITLFANGDLKNKQSIEIAKYLFVDIKNNDLK